MRNIMNLSGKKVKGFKFESNASLSYISKMDKYIGQIGTITHADSFVRVQFEDDFWHYPIDEIEAHLVHEYPKVMEVSNLEDFTTSALRVVFRERCGMFTAWCFAETIEESEKSLDATRWKYAREVKKVEITLQDISDGKGVGVPPSLIKIVEK